MGTNIYRASLCAKHCVRYYICVLVTQSCPTLCDPMDGNLLGSSVHGILQARKLEWVAISFSKVLYIPDLIFKITLPSGRCYP